MKLHGNTTIFGYCNCAAFNQDPSGDESWFFTREERNAALKATRANAVRRGLSESASVSGIYPIKARASIVARERDESVADLALNIEVGSY